MENNFIKIIKEIIDDINFESEDDRYRFETLCDNYLVLITDISNNKTFNIIGYTFPLNNATSSEICRDKVACSDLLMKHNIPCVPGKLFAISETHNLMEYCLSLGFPIVIKNNKGTCGKNVFLISNIDELNKFISVKDNLYFAQICVNKFVDIVDEYRVVILNGASLLCYSKIRPYVIGDGESTVGELVLKKNIEIIDTIIPLNKIPQNNEKVFLNWKHNLCCGAQPNIINDVDPKLLDIACRTVEALNMNFCSVDVVKDKNNDLRVLEVNSGVMLEYVSHYHNDVFDGYKTAKNIYKQALTSMFNNYGS